MKTSTPLEELRNRIAKQKKETGRERGWFDKEFVFDYHENREWRETIGPLLPSWRQQLVFDRSYTYDVLDTWTTLSPLHCEENVTVLPTLPKEVLREFPAPPFPSLEEEEERGEGTPGEKKVIHLTSIPPAYARFPSQVAHDLGLQSSDVIISMASFSQQVPKHYLEHIYQSLRGQNAYFPEGGEQRFFLSFPFSNSLSRFLTPSSPSTKDIRENGMIQGRFFPLNGLSGKSPRTVKKQKRFLPSPEELKTGRKGHKLVILFASELPCWADSIGDYEEQKQGWKKLAETSPGVYYFEFNWGSPSQLVEVMRKVVYISQAGKDLVFPESVPEKERMFKTLKSNPELRSFHHRTYQPTPFSTFLFERIRRSWRAGWF